jgi:transcriptional regulator with XRE-family HTH domain
MSPVNTLTVNPRVLQWARVESGWPAERVAKRLQVKVERVNAWEEGKRQPTLRQIEELSRFLHRPLSVFFLPKPPELPPLAAEYRRLPGVRPGHQSPELRLAVRQMLTRRENALNLMAEMGAQVPEFELVARLSEAPAEVGARLRAALAVSIENQLRWRT